MANFFISYSRVDRDFAVAFIERLRRKFAKDAIWYDAKWTGDSKWWAEILKQINETDIFIYLLSNESVTASYCQAEFAEARRLRKLIIPVQVRDRTKVTTTLTPIYYVDMTAGVGNMDAQAQLIRAIKMQLDAIPLRRSRPVSKNQTPKPDIKPEPQRLKNSLPVTTPDIQISVASAEERTRTIPVRVLVLALQKPPAWIFKPFIIGVLILVIFAAVIALVIRFFPTLFRL